MVAVSWDTSPVGTTNPFQPFSTKSDTHPATLLTITGSPQDIASFTTNPQVSLWVGKTKPSASA
jgi:hypothetical protein